MYVFVRCCSRIGVEDVTMHCSSVKISTRWSNQHSFYPMGEVQTTGSPHPPSCLLFPPRYFLPELTFFPLCPPPAVETGSSGASCQESKTLPGLREHISVHTVFNCYVFVAFAHTALHRWPVEFCNMQMYAFPTIQLAFALALGWLECIVLIQAQFVCNPPHRSRAQSTPGITAVQREQAGISRELADDITAALQFERSKWVYGSVDDEEFYRVPSGTADAPPGTLLKLQLDANTSAYTLPAHTAISRFIYQTQTLNGTKVPASAYVLWPYLPRTQPNGGGYPVVAWAHGTTGGFGECAPSHVRDLWYDFLAPFPLVLQGYVVVAPDYAGLGVDKDAKGHAITHQYLANPSHANDLFYSVQAAQSAFTTLSKQFVVVGQSQGGGAAWGAAQRQALIPVEGYLGSVASSPVTNFLGIATSTEFGTQPLIGAAALIARSLGSVFPGFDLNRILTPRGIQIITLLSEIQGCNPAASEILTVPDLLRPTFSQDFYVQAYQNLTSNGGRAIAGPLLVIQGEADNIVPFQLTATAIDQTCNLNPRVQLEFATFANVTHEPVVYASQRIWLKWIEDRFAGVPTLYGCHRTNYSSARPSQYYQREINWFVQGVTESF